jgi:hypothetical protein
VGRSLPLPPSQRARHPDGVALAGPGIPAPPTCSAPSLDSLRRLVATLSWDMDAATLFSSCLQDVGGFPMHIKFSKELG